jgi:hypothetical protein
LRNDRKEANVSDKQIPFHRQSTRLKSSDLQGLDSERVSERICRLADNDSVSFCPGEGGSEDLSESGGADGQQPGDKPEHGNHWNDRVLLWVTSNGEDDPCTLVVSRALVVMAAM